MNTTTNDRAHFKEQVLVEKSYPKSVLVEGVEVPIIHQFGRKGQTNYPKFRVKAAELVGKFNSKVFGIPFNERFFGTETITDWKIGNPIIFQGEYDGHKYKDKGNVLENIENETLKYDYWSGFSGLEDIPDNYSIITYHIENVSNNQVKFSVFKTGPRRRCSKLTRNLLQQIGSGQDCLCAC